ncbi:extracellular solute-binding protein [Citreicella sp. C3M06]|uniref:extracellular solute-binding protein n=1 Tax=Citreicella sp. C3M06 TaxID=2841564 RepID=UPI001C08BFA6|nr:extracellular solute-binding protein [Citreicella sp. C3M06]MBU2961668.1 extracellular solute-binding protein [Citreicella sp. C3M06]
MQLTAGALAGGFAPAQASPLGGLAAGLGRALRVLVPDGSQANVRSVIDNFEAAHGCKVEMIVSDLDDINATLMLEAMLPDLGIDVALPATFGIPDLSEAGAILPLDHFAAEQGISSPGGIGDRFDDRLWGFQTDGDVYLMFYNRDMLEDPQHGAHYADTTGTPLAIPQTWEELDRQMAFFHRPEQGRFGGCLYRTASYAAWEWWARLHARGGMPFDDDCRADVANDAGVGALEAMIAASQHQTGAELGMFDNWKRYDRGDIYADIGWGGTQKALHQIGAKMRGRVANGPLPGGEAGALSYFNWGWSYVVARHCNAPALAYGFCDFAVSKGPSADAVAAVDGYFDPFRPEHYDDPRIIDVYGASFLKEHRKAMARPIPDLYIGRRQEYWDSLTMWLLRTLEGHVDPATALRNVADRWDSITERVSPEQQRARWHALRATYPQV